MPAANENGEEYYENFNLDYGKDDNVRIAGSVRGLIKAGKIGALPTADPFIKWLNEHLEIGTEELQGRIKPYYAADFGTKLDLKKGENPRIIIVNRKLTANSQGELNKGSKDVDVEVRDVWQPWLKAKCDFVVRYIVPNRVNLVKYLEKSGSFKQEIRITKDAKGKKEAWSHMTFKPTRLQWLTGKRNLHFKRPLDYAKLISKD